MSSNASVTPNLPIVLDELPTPKDAPTNTLPATQEPAAAPQPAGAGYMGKTGQIADIASNFLHGWLQGKASKQMNMVKSAENDVRGAKATTDVANQWLNNLVQNGASDDPTWRASNPDLATKYDKAKQAASSAWQNYVGTMSKYAVNPQPTGVGGKIKKALMPSAPELYAQGSLQVLSQMDPVQMITQSAMSKVQQQTVKSGDIDLANKQMTAEDFAKTRDLRDQYNQTVTEYQNLQKKGDVQGAKAAYVDMQTLQSQLGAYGKDLKLPGKPGQDEAEYAKIDLENQLVGIKKTALTKMQAGQDLTRAEQTVLGTQPKDAMEVYLNAVGPGKKFSTDVQAVEALFNDQAKIARANAAAYHQPSTVQFLKEQIGLELEGKLGRKPTEQEVATDFVNRYKPSTDEKADINSGKPLTPAAIQAYRSQIMRDVTTDNPSIGRQFTSYEVDDGKGGKTTIYNWNPDLKPEDPGVLGRMFGGKPTTAEDISAGKEQARLLLQQRGQQYGLNEAQVKQVFGGGPVAPAPSPIPPPPGVGTQPPPKGQPAPKPSPNTATGGTPKKTFSVSKWKQANPSGDANAAKVQAQSQGFNVVP